MIGRGDSGRLKQFVCEYILQFNIRVKYFVRIAHMETETILVQFLSQEQKRCLGYHLKSL